MIPQVNSYSHKFMILCVSTADWMCPKSVVCVTMYYRCALSHGGVTCLSQIGCGCLKLSVLATSDCVRVVVCVRCVSGIFWTWYRCILQPWTSCYVMNWVMSFKHLLGSQNLASLELTLCPSLCTAVVSLLSWVLCSFVCILMCMYFQVCDIPPWGYSPFWPFVHDEDKR